MAAFRKRGGDGLGVRTWLRFKWHLVISFLITAFLTKLPGGAFVGINSGGD